MAKPITRMLLLCVVCFLVSQKIAYSADQATLEQAKKEGQLVFYSGIFEAEARALISRFEQKYPFIKTTLSAPAEFRWFPASRMNAAGSHLWDVFNSAGLEGFVLLEQGHFLKYISPEAKYFDEGFVRIRMVFGPQCTRAPTWGRTIPGWCWRKTSLKIISNFWTSAGVTNWRSIQMISNGTQT